MRMIMLAGTLLFSAPAGAMAQLDIGRVDDMIPGCRQFISPDRGRQTFLQGLCAGDVAGVWEAGDAARLVCGPTDAMLEEAVRVVVQFVDTHPARFRENFTLLAMTALRSAWPCR